MQIPSYPLRSSHHKSIHQRENNIMLGSHFVKSQSAGSPVSVRKLSLPPRFLPSHFPQNLTDLVPSSTNRRLCTHHTDFQNPQRMQLQSIILASLGLTAYVSAKCCNPAEALNQLCEDQTKGTPCCGKGPCNFFCCHCKHGMSIVLSILFPLAAYISKIFLEHSP